MTDDKNNRFSGFNCPTIGNSIPKGYELVLVGERYVLQKVKPKEEKGERL